MTDKTERSAHIFTLSWQTAHPLKEAVKLCFEDANRRVCFSLKKGTCTGVIDSFYRLPQTESYVALELSTVGSPLERLELPFTDIELVLKQLPAGQAAGL